MASGSDGLTPGAMVFGRWTLHVDDRLACEGQDIHLPPKELIVLRLLLGSRGALRTKDHLLEQGWPDCDAAEESLTRCIYSLRKCLKQDKGFIKTVYGKGYRFTCPVTVLEPAFEPALEPGACCPLAHGYLAGQGDLQHATPERLRQALLQFQRCTQYSTDHLPSWCGLADTLLAMALLGLSPLASAINDAQVAVIRALALEPGNSMALTRLAFLSSVQGSESAAQRLFQHCLRNTDSADVHYYLAWHHGCWGRGAEAVTSLQTCLQRNPGSGLARSLLLRLNIAHDPLSSVGCARHLLDEHLPGHRLLLRDPRLLGLGPLEHGRALA